MLRAKELSVVKDSTSGGFFTPLSQWLIKNNGIICAAAYDENFNVRHQFIFPENGSDDSVFEKFRGSKYVQSEMGKCYRQIKNYLEKDRTVCFVGTTCQVNGLKGFLRKDYPNLYTVDLVCHGTPSPKLWRKYLDYQTEKNKDTIRKISFRSKKYGYHNALMEIQFTKGKTYAASARVDYMLKSFFNEIASRPICYQCPFKTMERCSDLTVYDCWHITALVEKIKDDDNGFTNVIIQSEKGKKMLDSLQKNAEIYPTDVFKAVDTDGIMVKQCADPHHSRAEFYKELDKHSLKEHIDLYLPVRLHDYILEGIKKILYRFGLMKLFKNK